MRLPKHLGKWTAAAKVLTVVAVLTALMGVYLTLDWAEGEAEAERLDHQSLRIGFEALAQDGLGPWQQGHVFDEGSLGVPYRLAPIWNVTVAHQQENRLSGDAEWTAVVEMRQDGGGGRTWWSHQEPYVLEVHEDQATLVLNTSDLVDTALDLKENASTPGRLRIEIRVQHTSMVESRDGLVSSMRTSRIVLEPQGDLVLVQTHDDHAEFHGPEHKEAPWLAGGFVATALATSGGALYARQRHPKGPVGRAILVEHLEVPSAAIITDPQSLDRLAVEREESVLYDPHQRVLMLAGEVPVAARLGAGPVTEDEPDETKDQRP